MAQINCNFVSYTLGYGIDIAITLPSISSCDIGPDKQPSHKLKAKFPVLYLLHGHGNDYKCWSRYTSMERYAEEHNIAVVTFNAGNKCYMNSAYEENYYDFLEKELPEFICANFPISERMEDTYLGGYSMGGYGTLAHGLGHPQSYRAIGVFSPAVEIAGHEEKLAHELPPLVDIYELLDQDIKSEKKLPDIFLCCGQKDFLYDEVVKFHNRLNKNGIACYWDAPEEYEHEFKIWDVELEKFMDWLPRSDYYSNRGIHKL